MAKATKSQISVFSTQLYRSQLKTLKLKKNSPSTMSFSSLLANLKHEMQVFREEDKIGQEWCKLNYPGGYTSYGSRDQLHRYSPHFSLLGDWLSLHVDQYLKMMNYTCSARDLELDTLWVNMMPKGVRHSQHIHPLSVISGTFYVETPKDGSPIRFEDPRMGLFMNSPAVKSNAPSSQQRKFEIFPKSGDVVLFESWLPHEVPVNLSKQERWSISFNFNWRNGSASSRKMSSY